MRKPKYWELGYNSEKQYKEALAKNEQLKNEILEDLIKNIPSDFKEELIKIIKN